MGPVELKQKLDRHVEWLADQGSGERARLAGADLAGADLAGANLAGADLYGADLAGANLIGADLYGANLIRADLAGAHLADADLSGANLAGANLAGADLYDANLYGANLADAYLADADLYGANLYGANLIGANLAGADLYDANLAGAHLAGADLAGAINLSATAAARTEILPREGEVIGWKKCLGGVLVKVRVPPDAKRSNATGRKCRAERVEVLEVVGGTEGISQHDCNTIYRVGEVVACDRWEANRFKECSGGIHFWLTRVEAEAW